MIIRMSACAIVLLLVAAFAVAAPPEEDLVQLYGSDELVSIATGRTLPVSRAPAVASVITRQDILDMGARDLDQVLEAVPGVHVSRSTIGDNPIYLMRGIYGAFNSQVLVLVNGIPITNAFFGNRGQVWGGMPVEDIERIEIIRGPGSALYGADAYAGVINIVTRAPGTVFGTEAGAAAGSFATREAWLVHGAEWGGWQAKVYLQAGATDGHGRTVESDAQTVFDTLAGTSASLAPGPVNTGRDWLDARLELSRGQWTLRAGYQGRRHVGTGAGAAEALDPAGSSKSDRLLLDATWHDPQFTGDWDVKVTASYYDVANQSDLVLFPPGADFSALPGGGGPFPQGVIGNPDVYERHYRVEASGLFQGWVDHAVRVGAGVHVADMYRIKEEKNFSQATGLPVPLAGGLQDVTDTAPFIRPHKRTVKFVYVQDEWNVAPDWSLTAGVRMDNYSDFGTTTNPRLALVWNASLDLTTKVLYGRAFRAPAFAEEFNINNPVALGNPDLEPETIDTVELAFDYRPGGDLRAGFNLFWFRRRDIIDFAPDPGGSGALIAQNTGRQTGHGFEAELRWKVRRSLKVVGNFAYAEVRDDTTDAPVGFAPRHQAYLRLDWEPLPGWSVHPQVTYVANRERSAGDPRDPVDDYTLVDVTVRRRPGGGGNWELALVARNLFDADAREPTAPKPPLAPAGFIPGDLPLAGRSYLLEARYHW